ncbi:hypothetical protein GCM10023191_046310 [Actinoallomurus oryzae]|uniref:Superoxide dismutase n=1 Tax=Actinoallomurus oryzae TaxID=502180 RepID=A0ABP8Q907_9ACTN
MAGRQEGAITRRRMLGYAGAAGLAGAGIVVGARPASASTYGFDQLFELPDTDNMQGLAYRRGRYYVGFDVGDGHGVIRVYDGSGNKLKETTQLAVGHAAELSFRDRDGHLYVATGGGTNPTKVHVVDIAAANPQVIRTIDFASLGNSGLVAVDNRRDGLLVHAGPDDDGPFVFAFAGFDGTVRSKFTLESQGVPQGLEMARDKILYYTNNTITVLSRKGAILEVINVPEAGESEGLAVAEAGTRTRVFVGYNKPNRVYAMRPAFS